jgi:Serine/threonine protein phosphatase
MKILEQPIVTPTRYLWAAGLDLAKFPAGSTIAERYTVLHSQVVIDTQTFRLPEIPDEFPEYVVAYLRLAKHLLHLPRPYGLLTASCLPNAGSDANQEILLLDNVPLTKQGELLPSFTSAWAGASALRQINWLWQVLHLWQSLSEYGFCQSLLSPELVRVDGPWIRLLELQSDSEAVSPSDLGEAWLALLDGAKPSTQDRLAELFYGLARGSYSITAAIAHLDETARQIAEQHPWIIRVASATDPGRRREHNEDSCYPHPNQQTVIMDALQNCVAIVCDGLGGHEGGEVASNMAIQTLCTELEPLLAKIEKGEEPYDPSQFMARLEAIIRLANDRIVNLNDQQQRTAQRRMGTTLVMTVLPRPRGKTSHEIYIVHVGDSRIYWITPESCRQVTLDDDVATRETTLGLNFYAYSSQRVDAGALIQALGTRSSDVLVPRVQRLLLDEECLLLLCSDGLSDFERVDELYSDQIRPILTDRLSLSLSCQNLINQGNFLNGHDNITVVLMRCQASAYEEVNIEVQRKIARSRQFASGKTTAIAPSSPPPDDQTRFEITDPKTKQTSIQTTTRLQTHKIKNTATTQIANQPKSGQGNKWFLILWLLVFFVFGFAITASQIPALRNLVIPSSPKSPPPPSPR